MADTNSNLSPFAEGYDTTPLQVASMRDYAKALMTGSGQQPVHHWTQGLSNMVAALMGGMTDYNATQKELAGIKKFGHDYMPPDASQSPQAPVPAGGFKKTSNEVDTSGLSPEVDGMIVQAAQKYGVDPDYLRRTAMIESSGNPNSFMPTSHAAGLFQFIPSTARQYGLSKPFDAAANTDAAARFTADNTRQLTQALGRPPTPGELYLAHQQGVGGALKLIQNPNAPAVNTLGLAQVMNNGGARSMTGQQFANMWTGRFPGAATAAAPVALPNSGSIQPAMNLTSPAQPDAAQTSAAVLRGDQQPTAESVAQKMVPPVGSALPQPQGQGPQIIPPGIVPHLPQYSRQQVERVLSSPWASPAQKEQIRNEYLRQNQPVEVPVMGGKAIYGPHGEGPYFVPDVHYGTRKTGDLERPSANIVTPYGAQVPLTNAPMGSLGPRSEAAPSSAPAVAPGAGGGQPAVTPAVIAQNAPAAPAAPSSAPQNAQAAASPQDVAQAEEGVAGAGEGSGQSGPGSIADQSLRRWGVAAANGPPPGVDVTPEEASTLQYLNTIKNRSEADKEAGKQAAEYGAKKYDALSTQAAEARKLQPNVDLALQMMNDPNFHSGLLSGAQDTWARFKSLFGDRYANAPNETFDKLIASNVLGTMKTALGGLGQVRLAEINLLNKANGSRYNTDASNRAVLELSKRALSQLDNIGQMADAYASGDEVVDPQSGATLLKANVVNGEIAPRHGLDAGFNKLAAQYVKDHPTMTPEEIKRYETIFDSGRDPSAPAQEGPGVKAPMEKKFSDGKGGFVTGTSTDGGKTWQPKK